MTAYPVLYSFRRCPYAMRARLALVYARQQCELREVHLKHKPDALLQASPKGTVPVLVLPNGTVIDESLDIMRHAIQQHDPDGWAQLSDTQQRDVDELMTRNDQQMASLQRKYKYFERYPEASQQEYRQQLEEQFLQGFEQRLNSHNHLVHDTPTMADMALLPFIRQLAMVDEGWFAQSPYPRLRDWMQRLMNSPIFEQMMHKHSPWQPGDNVVMLLPV